MGVVQASVFADNLAMEPQKGKLVHVLNVDQIIGGLCHMYTHTQPYTGEGLMALMK